MTDTKEYRKPVTLTRTFRDGSVFESDYEFYHLFSKAEIDPAKNYEVSLYGIDKNGEYVKGTEEKRTYTGPAA